ncbi:ABC transporter ATP-binding protein [Oenococcus kitaharae]|uniref:ABC transporterATP-binding protein n=1 Tax=Oenococcus kitaharae DSM 17330 TaxID=1045004 RepID=G9WEP4_9LACO|nr:ABC transporter ATP-binding protein [Oenococcus kitaharae]EHN58217.1 ABC transporterATP-binding protein [Oenococcus kitaharae DSM 17330]OEY81595.1 sodium ABC transporter ATP-binding protein [Oenococcus kitaharae]OEY83081.1 sodium ABC transporter ATP-binding protein [Oenococcus kitaharae]OEY84373.1 sodium ABC transporter ATP-binding protein [Oenococcus kitaharae]
MLKLENISKTFGDLRAVVDESWELADGRILGLIGQNGAGKSTTFKMILNFIEADSGQITWNGRKIDSQVMNEIGFLPEERGLYPDVKIGEQILYFAELHGKSRQEIRPKMQQWMDKFDVKGKLTDKVKKLSKGNQQKVQLITALIHEPKLIILDEPFSGLDPVNAQILLDIIVEQKKNGAAIIYSSHDMNNVSAIADDVIMLNRGHVVLNGETGQVRQSFGRTMIYLESPATKAELSAIPGVVSVEDYAGGLQVTLSDPKVGRQVFELATKNGYITAFDQQPPTLEQIFKMKIGQDAIDEAEKEELTHE